MKKILLILCLWLSCQSASFARNEYQVLCFHDVRPQLQENGERDDVTVKRLANYFSWLKRSGFNVISVQDVINASNGVKELPKKAVLLSFDDGLHSFYLYVYPLLKAFNYPATLAVVGSWLDTPANGVVEYGDTVYPRSHFVSIPELKEMAASGLVEVASHSYSLHAGIPGNFQENKMPAATTLKFNSEKSQFESQDAYVKRVSADLEKNSAWISKTIGKKPRVIVWPYGSFNGRLQEIAKKLDMPIMFTLVDGVNVESQPLNFVKRIYLIDNPPLPNLADDLNEPQIRRERVMHVDLDSIYDLDPAQEAKNIDLLLARVKLAGVSTVYLQAFSDDDGSGAAKSLYFHNRNLPIKRDLFSKVSWELQTIGDVKVFAWMPLLSFSPPDDIARNLDFVVSDDGSQGIGYKRLSPFSAKSRKFIQEIYEDLARYNYFDGILIHDDATLSDQEDASPDALRYYSKNWGMPGDISAIKQDPALNSQWVAKKTAFLTQFSLDLRDLASKYRKPILLARNYYAEPVLNAESEARFSQNIHDGIAHFDWVVIMAMPYLEKSPNPQEWLNSLVSHVQSIPGSKDKVLYELQSKDWNTNQPIKNEELVSWMQKLRADGVSNFGYYPDDPYKNQPDINLIRRQLSLKTEMQ